MNEDFHKSCRLGDLLAIEKIITASPEVIQEIDSSLGWSGIYRCVVCGHFSAVNLLLQHHADPNLPNTSGETPLHQAVESDQYEIAELLLNYKASPNVQREDGDSPLHLAVSRSLEKMVVLLLSYNADPLLKNSLNAMTPLDYANDKEEIFQLLTRQKISNTLPVHISEYQASPSPDEIKSLMEPEIEDSTKNSLYQWLARINLLDLFEILISQGYDDLNFLLEQMKSEPLTLELLEEIGIRKIGHRMMLLACLDEELFRYLRKSVPVKSSCCSNKNEIVPLGLEDWLCQINLRNIYKLFVENGFTDMEQIVFLMNTSYPINDEVLRRIGVLKIGHRQRILIKIKEECKNPLRGYSFILAESEARNTACGYCVVG